ncbi:MAG: hypothetical protein L0H93_03555, partial [Nocardioides sp.]|nr:hypothetical protein [Nocardioides sp.]
EQPSVDFTLGGQEADMFLWEEPPVENRELLPPPATEQTWDPAGVPAEGDLELGGTYADAPGITEGKYGVHVDPGEPALFRTDLDWNQHLQVNFTYDGKGAGDALLYSILINPIGATSDWGTATDAPGSDTILTSIPGSEASVVSPSITWRNREADGNTAALAGTYYVMLRLGTVDAPKAGVDLTLSVKVVTDKDPQSPYESKYDDVMALDISGHAAEEEAKAKAESASSETDSTPWVAVGGLLGGAVVMAGAGGVSLSRHRRSRA